MRIKMDLNIDNVNQLCSICDSCGFEVDIVCGIKCVDGKSTLGVMELCNHTVEIVPIAHDYNTISEFYSKIEELGAYMENEE